MAGRPKQAATFVLSAPDDSKLPRHGRHEIAVVGRSNVGKSSLLGRLLGAPSLVRTSRTPGRTQLLNLFYIGDHWAFVDLPGYGYAKLSLAARARLQSMVDQYLFGGHPIAGVLLLLDGRRDEVVASDRAMVEALIARGLAVLVVVTKCDLLAKTSRQAQLTRLGRSLGVPASWLIASSSKTSEGLSEVWTRLYELAEQAAESAGPGDQEQPAR